MKKIIFSSVILIVLLALSTACGGNVPPQADSAPSSESGAAGNEATPGTDDLIPLYPDQIANGTYTITATSSSSMFRIVDVQLTVSGSEMSAVLTLGGTGYEKLFMGTGKEALAASDGEFAYFVEDSEGAFTYLVPIEALDKELDVAAWSIRKEKWYDRICVFESSMIPSDAITPNQ